MTPEWIIKLDDAPSSVAIEYHTEVKTFDDQDWGAPWNANASSLKGAELSIYGRWGNRFLDPTPPNPSIITARSPRCMSVDGARAETICSRRAFLCLTDAVEKTLAVNSEW
jgi:hypothetical protein